MRASSVTDKRVEIAFGLVLVQHSMAYMTLRNDIGAENVLQKAQGLLKVAWELASCREK